MREGWEIRKLGDVCTRITDGSHNPPKGVAHSDFAMISSQNVFNDRISYEGARYLQEEDFTNEDKRTSVRNGDVLLTIVGTVGRCAVFSGNKRITLQRSVAVLHPQSILNSRFLMHCLISKSDGLNDEAHGIAQKGLYLKQLAKVTVPVPPIQEQEKIVEELDCLTVIIEKKQRQLKELDKLAQSIFYDMFGDPECSQFPVKALSELSRTKLSYGSGASATPYDGDLRYIRITDIDENGELNNDVVSPSAFDEKYLLHEGDVLFARSGATVGKTYLYSQTDGKAIFAGYLIRVIPDTEFVLPRYLFNFTKTGYYRRFIALNAQAVAQPNINAKQYGSLKVVVPPLDLQNEFAKKIEAIERQKELIKRSIVETETLFNSRMDFWFN